MAVAATTTTTTMRNESKKDNILIFPFMAQGHTVPLLHLAATLSHQDLSVTILTTPANAPSLRRHLPSSSVQLAILPFPNSPILPPGCESTDCLPSFDLYPAFLAATTLLRPDFHRHLQHTDSLPLCVISDFHLFWTLDVCRIFDVPRVVFHGMSAFSMYLCKSFSIHRPHKHGVLEDETFSVPGAPENLRLVLSDIPVDLRNLGDPGDPAKQFLAAMEDSDINSWGVIVNSFAQLEGNYVECLESLYRGGGRVWLVGPLSLLACDEMTPEDDECITWLDGKPQGTVVYVAFGTQADVAEEQLDEVAYGLEEAGCEYLWVVRSPAWRPPTGITRKKGKIVGWAPQREVLEHEAIGGFVSHCGWNSALESMVAGVPVLAWPMIGEQGLNAKFLVDELGVGFRISERAGLNEGVAVGREEIEKGVRELMNKGGEKGNEVRERMEELGRMARVAMVEGGCSRERLKEMIEELRRVEVNKKQKRRRDHEVVVQQVEAGVNFEWQEDRVKIA